MAEHFVIIGRGRLIQDISAADLRATAVGEAVQVRSDRLDELIGLMRSNGVTIDSNERGVATVTGLEPERIGIIARDNDIALTALVDALESGLGPA